jgi:Synergist-CTERM protein sorting domain-containing protein
MGSFELTTFSEPIKPFPVSSDEVSGDALSPVLKVVIPVPAGDTLKKIRWQIAKDDGFKEIVFDSDLQEDEGLSISTKSKKLSETASLSVPKGKLTYGTDYYIRVRPLFEKSGWTDWSETSKITTETVSGSDGGCSVAGMEPGWAFLLLPLAVLIGR